MDESRRRTVLQNQAGIGSRPRRAHVGKSPFIGEIMPCNYKDLTGKTFGRLKVVKGPIRRGSRIFWGCICSCPDKTKRVIVAHSLNSGRSKSCGCLHDELLAKRSTRHGAAGRGKMQRAYSIWKNVRGRCNDIGHRHYEDYGGRGIKVYPPWDTVEGGFEKFRDYVAALPGCPKEFLESGRLPRNVSLDRIKNHKGYRPGNLRWATQEQQNNNRRVNIIFRVKGKMLTLKQAVDQYGVVKYSTAHYRIRVKNWTPLKAITTPLLKGMHV